MPRGRFAPSPTGDLHLGGARTALVAWLAAGRDGAPLVLRVEDLDGPRVVAGATERILEDLAWLGLHWDEGPLRQSDRLALYQEALERLDAAGRVFRCYCTRAEVARAGAAPHGPADDGPRYPGTCRELTRDRVADHERAGRRPSLRLRVNPEVVEFTDGVAGAQAQDVAATVGDFVLRRADGLFAYQLAVVVDDGAMAIAEVVRGDDLLGSTPRQLLLHRALEQAAPAFAHLPLVLGSDGQRLAKRHGAIAVRQLREAGRGAREVVGWLASSLGLCEPGQAPLPEELRAGFALARLNRAPTLVSPGLI